jgi:hypothetical protein
VNLDHNNIRGDLPATMGLLQSLKSLDLSFNQITGLPRSIIGLSDLQSLSLSHNRINTVPDTISSLHALTTIDFSANNFTKFPIILKEMSQLKSLDLSNNSLSLLPRNISDLTMLSTLDLSKNLLRAIPIEFANILETVPQVGLWANPWGDLPQKWGKVWSQDRVKDCPYGNSVAEAVDFLYGMKIFYNTAEIVWQETGALHYVCKLSMHDFIQELRERLLKSWHEGLLKHAEFVYMKVRQCVRQSVSVCVGFGFGGLIV